MFCLLLLLSMWSSCCLAVQITEVQVPTSVEVSRQSFVQYSNVLTVKSDINIANKETQQIKSNSSYLFQPYTAYKNEHVYIFFFFIFPVLFATMKQIAHHIARSRF